MNPNPSKAIRLIAFANLVSLLIYTIAVLYSQFKGFHGFAPMDRSTILTLRTAFAAISIFIFFPIVWVLNRKGETTDSAKLNSYAHTLLALAQSPAILGLALFFIQGAFKTYFAFLVLSGLYLLVCWPRSSS